MEDYCTNIYKEDIAIEARKMFKKYFKYGSSDEEGIEVIKKYFPSVCDTDERPIAVLIIAEELWKIGHLTSRILYKAKMASIILLRRKKNLLSSKDYIKHEKSIERLVSTITSPQPIEKTIKRIPLYEGKWIAGDILLIASKKSIKVTKQDENKMEHSEIISSYNVLFIVESTLDNIITGYVKYNDTLREKQLKLNAEQINSLPYIDQKYRMHMLGNDQAKNAPIWEIINQVKLSLQTIIFLINSLLILHLN